MLYIYEFDFEESTEEEIKVMENCKELRKFDDYSYISKSNTVILNGAEVNADSTFCVYLLNAWDGYEPFSSKGLGGKYEMEIYEAISVLRDNLMEEDERKELFPVLSMDRIFNADNPYAETYKMLKEIFIKSLDTFIWEMEENRRLFCKENGLFV